ncbi:hypothetical protein SAMN04487910_3815 [Aquimarina amphilecti]|uniref:DUF5723 domain-containing protein n=1 Tax=Aquimarina amphilecti TaxID=1038014 RepID=A0A1H7UPZ6_AQUAM|nr:DUF5723 family protein [Aquimarina amphilecti]SEL98698.1 hypothetical protein SAMN04487910_3815 [Aquimarina amphilecti]
MRILLCLYLGLLGYSGYSQNKETLYDFTDLPQSLMLNPGADVNFKYHAGVPFLSQIHLNVGFRGTSIYDIFADDGRDINDKIENTINTLTSKDYFTLTQQLDIINFGWRSKNNKDLYYSAGLYQELDLIVYFPKDFAVLAYQGNQDFINVPFRFSNISATGELLTVYHFGYNKKVSKKLTFGARAKLYSSMFNFRSTKNRGTFTTIETPQGNNIYQHVISNADVSLQTAGYASLRDIESEDNSDGSKQVLNKFLGRAFLGGNLGVGFDVGFTYKLEDQWTITGSATDLGVIFYTKDVETYQARGNFVFEGFETPITDDNGQDILDELEEAIPIDTLNTSYAALRPLKLNGSIKYSFNRYDDGTCNCFVEGEDPPYQDAFGLQVFSQFRPKRPQYAASLFYYKRLSNFLKAKLTYTVDDYSYKNIGFLMSTHINKINFYISANNLLEYSNLAEARGASIQLGFNVIM